MSALGPVLTPAAAAWVVKGIVRAASASLEGHARDEEIVLAYRALGAAACLCAAGDQQAEAVAGLRAQAVALAAARGIEVLDLVAD